MEYSDTTWLLILFFLGVIQGAIGALIGSYKGRTAGGFWLGFFLGVIGWILVMLGPDHSVKVGTPAVRYVSANDPDIQAHMARKAQRGE